MTNRRGGTLSVRVNGQLLEVVGSWEIQDGSPMREALVGFDGVHGYKETPQAPSIQGTARYSPELDIKALKAVDDATITVELPNGKTATLRSGWFAGEGTLTTEEGEFAVRYEGKQLDLD